MHWLHVRDSSSAKCCFFFVGNRSMAEKTVKFLEEQGTEFWAQFEAYHFGEDSD
jgi:hypothetical protein